MILWVPCCPVGWKFTTPENPFWVSEPRKMVQLSSKVNVSLAIHPLRFNIGSYCKQGPGHSQVTAVPLAAL